VALFLPFFFLSPPPVANASLLSGYLFVGTDVVQTTEASPPIPCPPPKDNV